LSTNFPQEHGLKNPRLLLTRIFWVFALMAGSGVWLIDMVDFLFTYRSPLIAVCGCGWAAHSRMNGSGRVHSFKILGQCYNFQIIQTTNKEIPMKGNEKVLAKLNDLLADELTAISQYMVHAEMCDDWGYKKLAEVVEKRSIDEMKHAETLIGRILFLEGKPIVSELKKMFIGAEVPAQFKNDHTAEEGAIKSYNDGIKLCADMADNGTRDILIKILNDEEAHIDLIEAQLGQVEQIGLQNYLVEQI